MDDITADQSKELENKVLAFAADRPAGVSDAEIARALPSKMSVAQRSHIYNSLLAIGRLTVFLRQSDGQLLYKESSATRADKLRGLTTSEQMVCNLVEKSSNTGIWSKILRMKSGIPRTQLNKICKTLESRKLIKAVKSVQAKTKKIYMAYDIEPSTEVTGGPWYSDTQELDLEFIEVLYKTIYKYLCQNSLATAEDVAKFVHKSGMSREALRAEDIETILDTLIFDSKVEVVMPPGHEEEAGEEEGEGSVKYYRISKAEPSYASVAEIPCSVCPVAAQCTPGGRINPVSCEYFNRWLEF